jgi:hypothetical protein
MFTLINPFVEEEGLAPCIMKTLKDPSAQGVQTLLMKPCSPFNKMG